LGNPAPGKTAAAGLPGKKLVPARALQMMKPFKKTLYNCKQATLLSLKRDEGRISLVERVKLAYHLLYCEPCRKFNAVVPAETNLAWIRSPLA
jgi:hypothetical protein